MLLNGRCVQLNEALQRDKVLEQLAHHITGFLACPPALSILLQALADQPRRHRVIYLAINTALPALTGPDRVRIPRSQCTWLSGPGKARMLACTICSCGCSNRRCLQCQLAKHLHWVAEPAVRGLWVTWCVQPAPSAAEAAAPATAVRPYQHIQCLCCTSLHKVKQAGYRRSRTVCK